MSKKTLITLILLLLLITAGIFGYFFYSIRPTPLVIDTNKDKNTHFPFGSGNTYPTNTGRDTATSTGATSTSTSTRNTYTRTPALPVLRHLSTVPTAGAGAYDSSRGTQIRYIERGTGYIYQASNLNLDQIKLSNTPIIKIYEALWTSKNNALIIRRLKGDTDTIDSFYSTLNTTPTIKNASSTTSLSDSLISSVSSDYLGANISSAVLSPKKDSLFYLIPDGSGGVSGIIAKVDGTKKVLVFSSPLKGWVTQWPADNTIALTSKSSSKSAGFLYFVSSLTGSSTKVLGGINGFTTLTSTDTNTVLYSKTNNDSFTLNSFNVKNGNKEQISLTTLPEKCVWSAKEKNSAYCAVPKSIPSGSYPESWYQGKVFFNDEIWKIDTFIGTLEHIADLNSLSGQEIDATNLSLNGKEDLLLFTNKQDLTLWSLDI